MYLCNAVRGLRRVEIDWEPLGLDAIPRRPTKGSALLTPGG